MDEHEWLAQRFEAHRAHMRSVAYRMLGSLAEADDAVQEAWLRLGPRGTHDIENLGGWLTTVVARVCLDMLRLRKARREELHGDELPRSPADRDDEILPEEEALLADSVGIALLTVLETLTPAERLAFVLHDLFEVPFDEITPIVGRSPAAARQLASRARRRVRGAGPALSPDLVRHRAIVDAFLAAARDGDFEGLLALLDPGIVLRADAEAVPRGRPASIRGARGVARQATMFSMRVPFARPALINGLAGVVVTPPGQPLVVLAFTIGHGKITKIDIIANSARLRQLDLAVLGN
jgi:RNA polymerase sigma factor (sigma-70 family)